jgi:mannose-6-phosphate isomerase
MVVSMLVHPLIFEPIYKPRIWGGDSIFSHLGRPPVQKGPIGESWELADLEDDQSRVTAGPAKGRPLGELVREWGQELMGRVPLFQGRFPLLIKFLDARQTLSVQVHPSEAVAKRLGGAVRVKNEAWYVLSAEPGALIYHGLEPGITRAHFRDAMLSGHIEGVLRRVPVKTGECYYLPSGTPHALGAGVLAAEVQTPSDTTYRTYDWGRVDPATGQPRELHLEQALDCIDFDSPSPPPAQERSHVASLWTAVTRLVACPSFVIEQVRMVEGLEQAIPYAEPVVWIVLDGRGEIIWRDGAPALPFERGQVVLLPAALKDARVRVCTPMRWLEVTVPVPSDLAGYAHPPKGELAGEPPSGLVQLGLPRASADS